MARSGLLWLLLGVLGLGALVLIVRQDAGTIAGLSQNRFAQAVMLTALLAFVAVGAFGRGAFGQSLRNAFIWLSILVLLIAGYTYRNELEWIGRRMTAELIPGAAIVERAGADGEQVVISRGWGGHFGVRAEINLVRIPMMVDTGASLVTLTTDDARAAGIAIDDLRYSVPVATANGTGRAAPVVLDSIVVGSIERRRVPALVAQPGMLEGSLLGMSFIDTLGSFSISGDRLILTP